MRVEIVDIEESKGVEIRAFILGKNGFNNKEVSLDIEEDGPAIRVATLEFECEDFFFSDDVSLITIKKDDWKSCFDLARNQFHYITIM